MQASIGNNDLNLSNNFLGISWNLKSCDKMTILSKLTFSRFSLVDHLMIWLVVDCIYIHWFYFVSFFDWYIDTNYEASLVACVHFFVRIFLSALFFVHFSACILTFLCKFSALQFYTGEIGNLHFTIRFKLSQSRVSFTS